MKTHRITIDSPTLEDVTCNVPASFRAVAGAYLAILAGRDDIGDVGLEIRFDKDTTTITAKPVGKDVVRFTITDPGHGREFGAASEQAAHVDEAIASAPMMVTGAPVASA